MRACGYCPWLRETGLLTASPEYWPDSLVFKRLSGVTLPLVLKKLIDMCLRSRVLRMDEADGVDTGSFAASNLGAESESPGMNV